MLTIAINVNFRPEIFSSGHYLPTTYYKMGYIHQALVTELGSF